MGLFSFKRKVEPTKVVGEKEIKEELQDNGFPKKEDKLILGNFDQIPKEDSINTEKINDIDESNKKVTETNKSTSNKKPILSYITLKKGINEGTLDLKIKAQDEGEDIQLSILDYEFVIRKDAHDLDKPFRLLCIGGSVTLTDEEVAYIFTRFRNIK